MIGNSIIIIIIIISLTRPLSLVLVLSTTYCIYFLRQLLSLSLYDSPVSQKLLSHISFSLLFSSLLSQY